MFEPLAMQGEPIPESWRPIVEPVLHRPEMKDWLMRLEKAEREGAAIHPPAGCRLRALRLTPLDRVKVVILGQDPYHGPGQAMGLCFSVPPGVRHPPSLRNIFRELLDDLEVQPPLSGDLTGWAKQGVLLLNTVLTVEEGRAGSHAGKGWEWVTDACIAAVAERGEPSVFILWGSHAQAKVDRLPMLQDNRHCVIRSPHPSPLSAYRGFFGSRPFSQANAFLTQQGRAPLDWSLTSNTA